VFLTNIFLVSFAVLILIACFFRLVRPP
jgi:hypothetical protein